MAALLVGQVAVFPASKASASERTFSAGSLIIPMDVAYQNSGMWKAYGLVYELLSEGVPVAWAIAPGKTFNGIDFTASARDYRTNAAVGSFNYTGGPFIIESAFVTQAQPIIQAWWAANANQPAVHVATSPFQANVEIVLTRPPRIALEETNAGVAITYFTAAGIPDLNGNAWSSLSPNVLGQQEIADGALFQRGVCSQRRFDLFVTPHNSGYDYSLTDPANLGTRTYAQLDTFVQDGGGWLALCHSILSNENAISNLYRNAAPAVRALFTSTVGGGFLTKTGFAAFANAGGTWTVNTPWLPLAQAVPTTVAQSLPGGSVQTWNRTSVVYHAQAERAASFVAPTATYDWAVNGVTHDGDGLGKVTFLGGHSYSTALPYASNFEAPYLRFFFNALFFNGAAVAKLDLGVSTEYVPVGLPSIVTLSIVNDGASTAEGSTNVAIRLPAGVTYVESLAGYPAPSVSTDAGTGVTTLYWGAALGDVPGGAAGARVRVSIAPTVMGDTNIAHLDANYGDSLGEAFTADICRAVQTYQPAALDIAKTLNGATSTFYPGQAASWTLAYRNTGDADVLNGVVEDILPSGYVYKSSSVTPLSVVPLADGTTRIRWDVGTITAKAAPRTITLSAFLPGTVGVSTNTGHVRGSDRQGYAYQASGSSTLTVIRPPIDLAKSVSPSGPVEVTTPGQVLTYSLRPHYAGDNLLRDVLVSDGVPANSTYLAGSANAGGAYGFTPLPKVDADDATMRVAISASPSLVALAGTVNLSMTLTNKTAAAMTVVPSLAEQLNGATIAGLPASVTVPANASIIVNCTATMDAIGERFFVGSVEVVDGYSSATARSNTILVVSDLKASPPGDVVTWRLGTNTPGNPGEFITSGLPAGLYAFRGANTKEFSKYTLSTSTWASRAQPTNGIEKGGSLTVDSATHTIYASEGNSKWFYKYDAVTNVWTRLADTSDNFNEGGGTQYLEVAGVKYVFAVLGNSNRFRRYNVASNTWTTLANTPANVAKGGGITTDGTSLYVLQGDGKTGFWRYNIASNTWTAMAATPGNVGWGGSIVRVGGSFYALQGGGQKGFWRYDIAANTWTAMAATPGNVADGGSLTTDGTSIYALQGKSLAFWKYDIAANTWTTLSSVNFAGAVGQGGALAYDPGIAPQGRFAVMSTDVGLITTEETITVTMNLTASPTVGGITPGAMTFMSTGGATATLLNGPTLVSPDDVSTGINDPVVYRWQYRGISGTGPGSLTFAASGAGTSPATTFPATTSRSVLVSPVLQYQAQVFDAASLPASVDQIQNVAMISDIVALGFGVDSNPVATPLLRPKLTIAKVNTPEGAVTPRDHIDYTVVVKNEGLGTARSVRIEDLVPAYASYVPGSAAASSTDESAAVVITPPAGGGPLVVTASQLGPDQSITVTFEVHVDVGPPVGTYDIANTATVSATGVEPISSPTVHNQLDVIASFAVRKQPNTVVVTTLGTPVRYTVFVTNTGDVPLHGVTVYDPMLPGLGPVLGPDGVHNSGDTDADGVLDLDESWVYAGVHVVVRDDVEENAQGYTVLTNTVTADTDETAPQTASADVRLEIAFTKIRLSKVVLPGTGYGTGDASTPFAVRLQNDAKGFLTDVVLTAGQVVTLDVPTGDFAVRELAVPMEYTRTGSAVVVPVIGGVTQPAYDLDGDDVLHVLPGVEYQVTFTNTFAHVPYFHDAFRVTNLFARVVPSP